MGKRRTIKIRGLRGKRHTKYPFFATDKDRKQIALVRSRDKAKEKQEPPTPTTGTM